MDWRCLGVDRRLGGGGVCASFGRVEPRLLLPCSVRVGAGRPRGMRPSRTVDCQYTGWYTTDDQAAGSLRPRRLLTLRRFQSLRTLDEAHCKYRTYRTYSWEAQSEAPVGTFALTAGWWQLAMMDRSRVAPRPQSAPHVGDLTAKSDEVVCTVDKMSLEESQRTAWPLT
jgi:hypothetical protein